MARLRIILNGSGDPISTLDITFPNADLTEILDANRLTGETDQQVWDRLAVKWLRELEEQGNRVALNKRMATAAANAAANYTERVALRTDPVVKQKIDEAAARERAAMASAASAPTPPPAPTPVPAPAPAP